MIELIALECGWIQWNNIACSTLIGICQIIKDQGYVDSPWEMYHGREMTLSGDSFHRIAGMGLPVKYYDPYQWPRLDD